MGWLRLDKGFPLGSSMSKNIIAKLPSSLRRSRSRRSSYVATTNRQNESASMPSFYRTKPSIGIENIAIRPICRRGYHPYRT